MYRGAILPGFLLASTYILYVMVLAFVRPNAAPAIPPEHRAFREANGSHGNTSLLVLMVIAALAAWAFAKFEFDETSAVDEVIVVSLLVWGATAFVIAIINRVFRLGMLSQIAERVTFVMIPPLALIFLVLGTIFIGVATPTEGGAMGA